MIEKTFTEFRQTASACLDEVEKGETIRLSRHGRTVAEIIPAKPLNGVPAWKRPVTPLHIPGLSLSKEITKDRRRSRF